MEPIIIIGGGIGGLATAIALQRKAFKVAVYEESSALAQVSTGVVLQGNAIRALQEIGIAEEILKNGQSLAKFLISDSKQKLIIQHDREVLNTLYHTPEAMVVHHADLQKSLLAMLLPDTLHTGMRLIEVTQDKHSVKATFEDGTSATGMLLIAADGLYSAVRRQLLPVANLRPSGYACWRGVVEATGIDAERETLHEIWGTRGRFCILPMTKNRICWYAFLNVKPSESRIKSLTIKELQDNFKFYPPVVNQTLSRVAEIGEMAYHEVTDMEPIKQFVFGRIALLGDAAHATTPNGWQDTALALEDAAVLANSLDGVFEPTSGLLRYEEKRMARTNRIATDAWALGRRAQTDNALMAWVRNTAIRLRPQRHGDKRLAFIHDIDFW